MMCLLNFIITLKDIGEINVSKDREHYYAEILNGIKFPNPVPIYNPTGGYYESIGYSEVRNKERPAWQNSIRKLSSDSSNAILGSSGLDIEVVRKYYV